MVTIEARIVNVLTVGSGLSYVVQEAIDRIGGESQPCIAFSVERSDFENPYLRPDAEELDAITAAQFVKQKFGTELAQLLVTSAIRSVIGVEPDKLRALFFVDDLSSATGSMNIISDTAGGGQYLTNRRVKLAAALNPDSIKLSEAVTKIIQTDDDCIVKTHKGERYGSKKSSSRFPHLFNCFQCPRSLLYLLSQTNYHNSCYQSTFWVDY
ncbi:hypothetical protein BGZ61DRAFT_518901 [Ilyonectria robusta]|uniref:uncharacterized protein n=1 Tax=Ilyonectria robusta TaxID=1079257 RepID=UPI001E8E7F60|nr:uncharacterized protein BGZ61DRAFT_518901 [Ilyonectria robusta]KAH8687025.1 hypothetical protein BGZ61DRAFT_518901 [Ilyonectria robusta]